MTVSGWGNTLPVRPFGENFPDTLQVATIPLIAQEECEKAYQTDNPITQSMFCAGKLQAGGVDSCQGKWRSGKFQLNDHRVNKRRITVYQRTNCQFILSQIPPVLCCLACYHSLKYMRLSRAKALLTAYCSWMPFISVMS